MRERKDAILRRKLLVKKNEHIKSLNHLLHIQSFFATYLWIVPLLWDNKKEFHQVKPWTKSRMINDGVITKT